jgi:CBS-domain-containing membrane protein
MDGGTFKAEPHPTMPMSSATPTVADIMTRTVVTAREDASLPELVDQMVRCGISGIPIVDTDSHLVGIVTEADLISKPAYGGTPHRRPLAIIGDLLRGHERRWQAKAEGMTTAEIMTTKVETARPWESVRAAARRMVNSGVKRLPVVDDDRLVGIVSRADVLRSMHCTDEVLQAEIAAALGDPMGVPEMTLVETSVTDGVVTLRGTVRYPIDLPVLTAIVWSFPGVVEVHNEATAREPNPQPQPLRRDDYDSLRFMR